jgi:hypothetical protein
MQQPILDLHSTGTWPLPRGTSFTPPIIRPQARPLGNRWARPLIAKRSTTNGFYSLDYWAIASPHKSEECRWKELPRRRNQDSWRTPMKTRRAFAPRGTLWLSLAGVLVAHAGTQPAYSFDYKIHPGSLCQPERGDQAANFIRFAGFIYQTNGLATYGVTCPIIRDRVPHFGRTDELTRIDAGIHFNFLSGQETGINCWWISMDEGGRQHVAENVSLAHRSQTQ